MAATSIARQRLHQQRLSHQPFASAAEVVRWLGAVQAQEYQDAKWSLGMRMQAATDATIERAFTDGAILRIHVMRPTWHFVTPDDIRWMVELTAPRVNQQNKSRYRQLELDEPLLTRTSDIIVKALEGGRSLTRPELKAVLEEAGINTEGQRLPYILHRAELDALICSGPRRGKQHTFMLLAKRAPNARRLERDAALAELTRRYFTGHGPATIHDFAWWSGLTIADIKAGLEMVGGELAQETIDGQTYWFAPSLPKAPAPITDAYLLPTFDEFLLGYGFPKGTRANGQDIRPLLFDSTIVLDGRIVGTWQRSFKKHAVAITITPLSPLDDGQMEAIHAAAARYADFLGLAPQVA